jgi:hypothetical protein
VVDSPRAHADIQTPQIEGLKNENLENHLNEKYLEESKVLYEAFMEEMGDLMENGGVYAVDSGYVIKTDSEDILSIGRYVTSIMASSMTTFTYDTIDKKEGVLITLPSLFKDDSYIERLSNHLVQTMKENMAADENLTYWLDETDSSAFKTIDPTQSFYINPDHQLVLSFDKYAIAPGYMGVLEFVIPYEVIEDLLMSNKYIH